MKKQVVVRTYTGYYGVTELQEYLNEGYLVVMCNQTTCKDHTY